MQDAEDWGAYIVSAVPAALWVAALLCAAIAIWQAPRPITFRLIVDRLLRYLFVFPLGVQGLWAFFSHVFISEDAANAIGWEPSPFQFEVGVANLGLALASFYAAFKGFEARAATAIAAACFLAGAGVGHLMDIAQGDNLTAGNSGPILYTDFLTPIAVLVLLIVLPRRSEQMVAETSKSSLVARIEDAQREAPPPRIEDEIERARQAMREALTAGPTIEVLPPAERPRLDRPRKAKRVLRKTPTDL
jgi:hypothetical protein